MYGLACHKVLAFAGLVLIAASPVFGQSGTRLPLAPVDSPLDGFAEEPLDSPLDGLAEEPLPAPELAEPGPPFSVDESAPDDAELALDLPEMLEGFSYPAIDLPSVVQSSGTWLRRGYWYAEQDVVVMNRQVFTDVLLAFDDTLAADQEMIVQSTAPSSRASARLTLGRFLYRDEKNVDHLAEFTFLGLGKWFDRRSITAIDTDRLFSPFGGDRQRYAFNVPGGPFVPVIGGFQAANTQRFTADSDFNSFEMNYRLRHRPTRDRLELGPNGQWTRKLKSNTFYSYLFGLRYFKLDEGFRWQSEALGVTETVPPQPLPGDDYLSRGAASGDMQIRTRNDLIGIQFGGDLTHQRPRWSIGVRGKAGPFLNLARQKTRLSINDPGGSLLVFPPAVFPNPVLHTFGPTNVDTDVGADRETLAFLAEMGVFLHYHLFPNVTLRTAYEAMWMTQVATATDQINLNLGSVPLVQTGGQEMYMGLSFGIDFYW